MCEEFRYQRDNDWIRSFVSRTACAEESWGWNFLLRQKKDFTPGSASRTRFESKQIDLAQTGYLPTTVCSSAYGGQVPRQA
jgi:hypothetical protein